MATITLYKDKLNGVGSLISTMVSSVNNLDMQLGALKSTLQGVNSSTYNLDSAVENIRSSSQTEQEKADDLNKLSKEVDNFITVTVNRDQAAKEEINKAKEDFYTKYSYLKPECEKDFIEKVVDTVESAADWCCDHWEVIAAIAAVIVVAVVVCVLLGPEALVPLVLNIAKGVLQGALLGGALGGAFSAFMGGDIVKGIKEGALAGGALGALGAVGSVCGCIIGCESAFGIVSGSIGRLTGGIATAMFDFDIVSMIGYKIDGENNKIYQINKECHSNQIYNFFQRGITAIAAFTGGMSSAMKCFIAGTVIATETGFARIEDVKPGDIVLSTNTDTMETGCKKVLEKYVRKTRELVHIIAGGKEIVSTLDHPYYVAGRGFVNACQLCIGSPLLDADGKILEVEQIYKEQLGKNEEVKVYNFQVEDWHTYHVGEMEVLVHNAEYGSGSKAIDTSKYTELSNAEVVDILKTRGLDEGAINDLLTSFDGPIYKRIGYEGEIFTITESKVGDASGVFVTRGSAGSTPTERINNLALPPNNSALIESQVELTRNQILLEGKVAPQKEWALIANDGIPRTGGAWQVVTDGGKYSNSIRR